MERFWEELLMLLRDLFYRIPLFSQPGYLSEQWDKYFSLTGFLLGLLFLGLLYAANKDKDDHPFKGMVRVLMMVAVINSCSAFWNMVCIDHPGADLYGALLDTWGARVFFQVENVFSGCLLTLALHTTYRRRTWAGASFGLVTRLALILMNYPYFSWLDSGTRQMVLLFVVLQAVLIYFLSAIITKRKNFSTSWLWYVGYQFIPFVLVALVQLVGRSLSYGSLALGYEETAATLLPLLPNFTPMLMISGIILAVGLVFDLCVRVAGSKNRP